MPSERSIPQELLLGLDGAYHAYENMSGDPLDHSPGYYSTVVLAQALSRGEKKLVILERSVKTTLMAAKSRKPGNRARRERRDGRFDILLERNKELL